MASRQSVAVRPELARVGEPRPQQDVALGGRRGVTRGHRDGEAAERVTRVARDRDGLRGLFEERPRQVPPLRVALAAQQQGDLLGVAAARAVDAVPDAALPAVERAYLRRLDELGEVDREHRPPANGPQVEAVRDPPAQLPLTLRLSLHQVGAQRPAHQVVEGEPSAERLGEAARLEPAQAVLGVRLGKDVAQQLERRDARGARHAEDVAVAPLDLRLGEPAHERSHHLAGLAAPGTPAAVLRRRDRQRQRERRAAGPVRELVAPRSAQPVRPEQLLGLAERERAELDVARDRLPAALEPAALGRAAPPRRRSCAPGATAGARGAGGRRARPCARRCRSGSAGARARAQRRGRPRRRPGPAGDRGPRRTPASSRRRGRGRPPAAAARSCRSRPARARAPRSPGDRR
jgi:hypothetical protein